MLVFLCLVVVAFGAIGNGVNLQPSYYNNGDVTFGWTLMKKYTQIKTVRIEIEPDKVTQAKTWISQARANGFAVIATYHRYGGPLGTDSVSEINAAAEWWVTNYAALKASGDFTLNLINEWGSHSQTASSYSSAYNAAIRRVRTVYSGPIICDLAGWGQEFKTAVQAIPLLTDKNIIFSAHIYSGAYNQGRGGTVVVDDVNELHTATTGTGITCMIGEFGPDSSSGCDVVAVVNRARTLGWPVLAWAWNGDGGNMNMVSPTWSSNPKAADASYTTDNYWWPKVIDLLQPTTVTPTTPKTTPTGTCTDTPPDSTYTCAQQVGWGKCSETFMKGFCDKSCGRCTTPTPKAPVPVPAPKAPAPVPAPKAQPASSPVPKKADWVYCAANSECQNNCCSNEASDDGKMKCTPSGTYCGVAGGTKLDWEMCTSGTECKNHCCSNEKSNDGQLKCTPGGFTCNNPYGAKVAWEICINNGDCINRCCSKEQSNDGKFKCTPSGTQCGSGLRIAAPEDPILTPEGSNTNLIIIVVCSILSVILVIAIAGVVYGITKSTPQGF